MAWRCRFLTARPSQDGRVIAEKGLGEELSGAPVALVDFHTGPDDRRALCVTRADREPDCVVGRNEERARHRPRPDRRRLRRRELCRGVQSHLLLRGRREASTSARFFGETRTSTSRDGGAVSAAEAGVRATAGAASETARAHGAATTDIRAAAGAASATVRASADGAASATVRASADGAAATADRRRRERPRRTGSAGCGPGGGPSCCEEAAHRPRRIDNK